MALIAKNKLEVVNAGENGDAPDSDDDSTNHEEEVGQMQKEHGGPKGPEPTRYGDWERKGRCIDF